ncbi:MAG: restriction endonuclease [Pseudomonadota bacterium]
MILRELREWEQVVGVGLTAVHATALARSKALDVTPSLSTPGAWDLKAHQHVGIVQCGDIEVRIRPKVGVSRLLWLAALAEVDEGWSDREADLDKAEELVTAMAAAFLFQAERALRDGVMHGYLHREEALFVLRGRLRVAEQVGRRFGFPLPVEVAWDDFTADVPENRLLRSAARCLLRCPGLPSDLRARARRLHELLDGVALLPHGPPPTLPVATRLNARYRPALVLSRMVLRHLSVEAGRGDVPGIAFLFDMNVVFQEFLAHVLGRALEKRTGNTESQTDRPFTQDGSQVVKPDLVWRSGHQILAVVDAKYKRRAEPDPADLYQVVAYSVALECPVVHIVYAGATPSQILRIRPAGAVEVHVHGLNLEGKPAEILARVENLAARIASATGADHVQTYTAPGRGMTTAGGQPPGPPPSSRR